MLVLRCQRSWSPSFQRQDVERSLADLSLDPHVCHDLVGDVPVDGLPQPIAKRGGRRPLKCLFHLGRIQHLDHLSVWLVRVPDYLTLPTDEETACLLVGKYHWLLDLFVCSNHFADPAIRSCQTFLQTYLGLPLEHFFHQGQVSVSSPHPFRRR